VMKPVAVATGFLQCFDAVGWVIWPVKIVPKMTGNVLSGTLSLYSLEMPRLDNNSGLLIYGEIFTTFFLTVIYSILCTIQLGISCHFMYL